MRGRDGLHGYGHEAGEGEHQEKSGDEDQFPVSGKDGSARYHERTCGKNGRDQRSGKGNELGRVTFKPDPCYRQCRTKGDDTENPEAISWPQ